MLGRQHRWVTAVARTRTLICTATPSQHLPGLFPAHVEAAKRKHRCHPSSSSSSTHTQQCTTCSSQASRQPSTLCPSPSPCSSSSSPSGLQPASTTSPSSPPASPAALQACSLHPPPPRCPCRCPCRCIWCPPCPRPCPRPWPCRCRIQGRSTRIRTVAACRGGSHCSRGGSGWGAGARGGGGERAVRGEWGPLPPAARCTAGCTTGRWELLALLA